MPHIYYGMLLPVPAFDNYFWDNTPQLFVGQYIHLSHNFHVIFSYLSTTTMSHAMSS